MGLGDSILKYSWQPLNRNFKPQPFKMLDQYKPKNQPPVGYLTKAENPLPQPGQQDRIGDISAKVPLAGQYYIDPDVNKNPMQGVGGLVGLLFGVGGGLLASKISKDQNTSFLNRQNEQMIKNKAIQPSYYARHGTIIGPTAGGIGAAVRAMKGEVAAMPNGMIVDVNSTSKKDKDITDVFMPGTYVAGDNEITKEEADKVIMGQTITEYNEFKKGKPVEELTLGRLFGKKKKMSVAELLQATKKMLPTPAILEEEIYDPFALETARENIGQRAKYVSAILSLDAKKNKSLRDKLKLTKNAQ